MSCSKTRIVIISDAEILFFYHHHSAAQTCQGAFVLLGQYGLISATLRTRMHDCDSPGSLPVM
jgi:hypothetical protein